MDNIFKSISFSLPGRSTGRDEPRRMHTKGPTARHPYTCGSIPQHNTLQHRGSMEPVMRGKMGLPSRTAPANNMFADGHTASNAPDLFRPPKLSGAGPGQYWGGGPPGKTLGCCQLFIAHENWCRRYIVFAGETPEQSQAPPACLAPWRAPTPGRCEHLSHTREFAKNDFR